MKTLTALRTFMCSWLLQASYSTAANIEAPGVPNPTEHTTTLAPPTGLDISDHLAKLQVKEENCSDLPIKPSGVSNPSPATLLPPIVSMDPEMRAYLTELYKNEENCSDLNIKALVELVKQKVSITPKCFAKVQGIETMTVEDYKVLQNIRNLFSYYNSSLPAAVLQILSCQHVSTFGSELGQPIGQNLALELLGGGIISVSLEHLHEYYSSGQNDLDISKVFGGTLFAWIGKYPTDVLKVKPKYLHAISPLSWDTILSHPDCLTRPFLESLVLQNVSLPSNLKIDKQSMTVKRTGPIPPADQIDILNEYKIFSAVHDSAFPLSTMEFVHEQWKLIGGDLFLNLDGKEAINLICRDLKPQTSDYRHSIGDKEYWLRSISHIFPENVAFMSTDVCVIFADFLWQFIFPEKIPEACSKAYIDKVIETKYIPAGCVPRIPSTWLRHRPEELFEVLTDLKLMGKVSRTFIGFAMKEYPEHKSVYIKALNTINTTTSRSSSEITSSSSSD